MFNQTHFSQISIDCKLEIDEGKYVSSFKTNIMDAVYAWAMNKSFDQVLELCEIYEGMFLIELIRF